MSKPHQVPMTTERARDIQRAVDLKPNATPQQKSFKARTSSTAANKKKP